MAEHSPLPWSVLHMVPMPAIVCNANGNRVHVVLGNVMQDGDAALIVRAVNNYGPMLEAMKRMRAWLEQSGGWNESLDVYGINNAIANAEKP